MNGLVQKGWCAPDGTLFPLSYYNPETANHHDAHKAEWEPVYTVKKEVLPHAVLTPAMRAEAARWADDAGTSKLSLECAEPAC